MRHTEGKKNLCFIHRTMYEYFVADGFVAEASAAENREALIGVIAWYWHKDKIDTNIVKYVKEKLEQNKKLVLFLWENAACLLLKKGAKGSFPVLPETVPECLHPVPSETAENDRKQDSTAFWNLCQLLTLVREIKGYQGKVFERFGAIPDGLSSVIRHCAADHFQILCPKYYLRGADLSGANLRDADLSGADLSGANLIRSYL